MSSTPPLDKTDRHRYRPGMSGADEAAPRKRSRGRGQVTISNRQQSLRPPVRLLQRLIRFVAEAEAVEPGEIDLAVVGSDEMVELNRRYTGRPDVTDVLSFDLGEEGRPLSAQVIVCSDVAAEQGPAHGNSVAHELMLYAVHGLLHLLGYDDQRPADARRMHDREAELLAAFADRPARND
jgi:probable rRNA maturation factor